MFYQFAVYFCCLYAFFFLLICAIPHLICKCLSLSYLRLSFLYLRHVRLRWLHLCPSIAICHMSHFNYVLLLPSLCISFSSSHVPQLFDVCHLHLSLSPSFMSAASHHTCHSPVFPDLHVQFYIKLSVEP